MLRILCIQIIRFFYGIRLYIALRRMKTRRQRDGSRIRIRRRSLIRSSKTWAKGIHREPSLRLRRDAPTASRRSTDRKQIGQCAHADNLHAIVFRQVMPRLMSPRVPMRALHKGARMRPGRYTDIYDAPRARSRSHARRAARDEERGACPPAPKSNIGRACTAPGAVKIGRGLEYVG